MANEIKKKGGRGSAGRNNLPQMQTMNTEPGDNSRYLRHALTTLGMPPIDISNAEQVEERLNWYFLHCIDNDMKPSVNGMCNALGIHRDTLHAWVTGEYRADTHQGLVQKAYSLLRELWEEYMLNGKVNPVSGIFLGKNMFGYRDQQDLVVTPNHSQTEAIDITTIEQKYAELPDEG